jgi:hypothetical protein
MYAGQKSVRGGIQDFLCPFTSMYITQGSNGQFSHMGTMANDVRGAEPGVRYPIYAPCDCRCVRTYSSSGQAMWQSLEPVRFRNERIAIATWMTCHDDTFDAYVGQVLRQGDQMANMGTKGFATGVHTHIQISQSDDTSWYMNQYGVYQFNNEYDTDDCYFVDNTEILEGMGGNWGVTSDVPVYENEYINFPPEQIDERYIYDVNTKEKLPNTLKVRKFGGLSYIILGYVDDGYFARIPSVDFGEVLVRITDATPITNSPMYEHGNY